MGITRQIAFVSSLPPEHHHQLEALLFFNGRQHRVRKGIETAIDRYGPPEIVVDGNALRVRVAGPSEAQCLFAVERDGKVSRPVGLILYVRDSFERITVVHVSVAEPFAAGGTRAGNHLLFRMVQAVRQVARRTAGIERVELLYSQERPNGDGVGKPLGILQSNCLETLLRVDANEIDQVDIANMWSRRWTGANDYVWLVHPSVFPQLINLTVGNFPVMMPNNNMRGGEASNIPTIYGRPVLELEYCQTLGTAGDIILASLSQYQTIQKGGVQAASSIHVAFTTDETAFRFVYRIDGQPSWYTDLTPLHASSDVSPFLVLGASV